MTYKVLSSLTANNINSADLLKVKTDLLIIAVNKKTSAAAELKGLQSIAQSLVQESIKEINSGSRKSIFLPAPAKVFFSKDKTQQQQCYKHSWNACIPLALNKIRFIFVVKQL